MAHSPSNIAERIDRLPAIPSVIVELVGLDPNSDDYPARVQDLVERDMSLAARVLGWANSASSGPREPIQSLPQAIMRMGARRAAQLITSMAVIRVFVPSTEDVRNLWRHALQTAAAAREFARVAGNGVDPQQAYLLGLLHDIGRFVIFADLPEPLRRLEDAGWEGHGLLEAECLHLGYDHAAIGWYACTSWGFPDDMCRIIQTHHETNPLASVLPPQLVPALRVVQQAEHVSCLLLTDPQISAQSPAHRREALEAAAICPTWDRAPLRVDQIDELLQGIINSSNESMRALGIAPV